MAYVALRWRDENNPKSARVQLPFTIGSGLKANVVVNSKAVAPLAKIIRKDGQNLMCVDAQSKQCERLPAVLYGLKIEGPYPGNLASPLRRVNELLHKEDKFWKGQSELIRKLALFNFGQKIRLGCWSVAFLMIANLVTASLISTTEVVVDRSKEPLRLQYAKMESYQIGAVGDNTDFAKGMVLQFKVPDDLRETDHVLQFEARYLNLDSELVVSIGNIGIYETRAIADCQTKYCEFQVPIAKQYLKSGVVDIRLHHRIEGGDYLVKSIVFQAVRPLSDQDMYLVERRIARAERAYQERAITHLNIVIARQEIHRALELVKTRAQTEELNGRLKAIASDIEQSYQRKIEELWFEIQRDITLKEYGRVIELLKALLYFYPDPTDPNHLKVKDWIKTVEELRS